MTEEIPADRISTDKNMKELLIEIRDKLSEKEKKKEFKLPFTAKLSNKQTKDNWVTVCQVTEGRQIAFTKCPIKEQTYMLNGVPRIATPEEILHYKGKPFIIQPSWSVKPFSPTDNYEGAIAKGYTNQGYRLLLNIMESEGIQTAKKIGWGIIVIGGLILLGVGYYLIKGGFH